MSVAAAERLSLEQLWSDETLSDNVTGSNYELTGLVEAAASVVTSRTALLDPVIISDGRVLKEMLDREDRERATIVMVFGYESRLTDLRLHMRRVVVNWMFEVTEEQQCEPEVFSLSVVYLDHVVVAMDVPKNRLQLVAAVCMFIASKFRDSVPLSSYSLASYTDHSITVDELLQWELSVLEALKWNVFFLTPYDFLDVVLWRLGSLTTDHRNTAKRHAHTIANVCITDSRFDGCPPSLMATACLNVALIGLKGVDWCNSIQLSSTILEATAIEQDCLQHWSEQVESSCQSMLDQTATIAHSSAQSAIIDDVSNVSAQSTCSETQIFARLVPITPSDIREISLNDG